MRPKPLIPTLSLAGAVAVASTCTTLATLRATAAVFTEARSARAVGPATAERCVASDAWGAAASLVGARFSPACVHATLCQPAACCSTPPPLTLVADRDW
jgi:hypothetical protein